MNRSTDLLTAARAQALFTSHLSASHQPTRADTQTSIRHAVRTHGGTRGCAAEVAAAYGDHPETAAPRMRWARGIVNQLYAVRPLASAPTLFLRSKPATGHDRWAGPTARIKISVGHIRLRASVSS
jgi:hypothetical protein